MRYCFTPSPAAIRWVAIIRWAMPACADRVGDCYDGSLLNGGYVVS